MDAQDMMRLMFDTTDAYDRADFDRLAEIYAEDVQWRNADANGPHCRNRDDISAMFRQRRNAGIRIASDEMRSTPTHVLRTARDQRLRPGRHRVQLPGTPHRHRSGLPLDGSRRGGDRRFQPAAN